MRLRPLLIGAPLSVLWLLMFTVSPLSAIIGLLIAFAWLDYRQRRAVLSVHPSDDDAEAGAK